MRGFIGLLFGLVIGVAGFWAYLTYTITSTSDRAWVTINSKLPAQAREWSCREVKKRLNSAGPAPEGCAEFWT